MYLQFDCYQFSLYYCSNMLLEHMTNNFLMIPCGYVE